MEDETAKRVEELVAKRVKEEIERRKDEIEAEVMRQVEEAKRLMEQQMLQELERKQRAQDEEEEKKKVRDCNSILYTPTAHDTQPLIQLLQHHSCIVTGGAVPIMFQVFILMSPSRLI